MSENTRRSVLAGAAGACAAALVGACGDDDTTANQPAPATTTEPPTGPLAKTSEIPVKGGKIFADRDVVVTQPKSGEFKAFGARCPHQGCLLTGVENGSITCKCHGARFALSDGSVQAGPAQAGLDTREIKIENDQLSLA